eukprot:COSAG02_NODE_796_length_17128_cov_176.587586_6_plen_95_part_00
MAAEAARARWLQQLPVACGAETLPIIANEEGRALGPMLPASAREHWPFFVLLDSCHAALSDRRVCSDLAPFARTVALAAAHAHPYFPPQVIVLV